jgi:hypothetical protein
MVPVKPPAICLQRFLNVKQIPRNTLVVASISHSVVSNNAGINREPAPPPNKPQAAGNVKENRPKKKA